MSRKGEAGRKRSEAFQGLEGMVHEFPELVRSAAIRLLFSFESDTLPAREDLAVVLVHLVDREQRRKQPAGEKRQRKVVRSEQVPPREQARRREDLSPPVVPRPPSSPSPPGGPRPSSREVRSVFHERIQEEAAAPEGPVSRLVRRRLGVSSDEKGRRRTEDGE